ncbi:MAG TPA: hypothetical protein VJ203_06915 [Bacteroidales bacterium]|nr:hypothetical protein [Bacteroidales bacterium]
MKTIRIIATAMFAVLLGAGLFAQTHDHAQMATSKTETFQVSGNCEMCKVRIEKAAKVDGVNKAEWSLLVKRNP